MKVQYFQEYASSFWAMQFLLKVCTWSYYKERKADDMRFLIVNHILHYQSDWDEKYQHDWSLKALRNSVYYILCWIFVYAIGNSKQKLWNYLGRFAERENDTLWAPASWSAFCSCKDWKLPRSPLLPSSSSISISSAAWVAGFFGIASW